MLRVCVLGPLAIEVDGAPVPVPTSLRARLLLGWLAVHPGLHGRSELAARLRPDVLDESARQSLRQALWSLRSTLGEESVVAGRERVGMHDGVWVDVREFERLANTGAGAEALAIVRGELLAGFDDDWVLAARDRQRAREDGLLASLAGKAARPSDAVALARQRTQLDPLSESAAGDLMRRLAGAGDRAGALAAYGRLRERLGRDLGVAPSPATRELAAGLRVDAAAPVELPGRLAASTELPFVGRRRELELLRALLEEARRTRSLRSVLVGGEPGMGKTALAARMACESGAGVLYGRCDEEPLAPYQPWAEALARIEGGEQAAGPELGRLMPHLASADAGKAVADPDGERFRLYDGALTLLSHAAAESPLVVVLDDLHWADAATLQMLAHVVRSAPRAPILLVGTYRHTEVAPHLDRALADLQGEPGVMRIHLHGLGDIEVGELVQSLNDGEAVGSDLAESISERTGGSPFFVSELVRHGGFAERDVPHSVREVIMRRVGRLGDAEALVLAAVMGMEFALTPLARAAAADEDAVADLLDRAVAAGLLVEPPGAAGRFTFAHALVRDALVNSIGATRRARAHGAVAQALTADPVADSATLARHFGAALGRATETLEWSRRAAREATVMLGYGEAAAHLARAIEVATHERLPARERCELMLELGQSLSRSGAKARADQQFDEAAALAREQAAPDLFAQAVLGRGGLGVALVDVDHSLIALLEEALGGNVPARLRARLLGRLAIELYYTGDEGRARGDALTAEAIELARGSGDQDALARALAARHVALWRPDRLDERLAVAAELVGLGGEAELEGRHWRFVDLMEAGDGDAMRAELDAYERLAAELRIPAWSWYVHVWRGAIAMIEGRFQEAERLVDAARDAARQAGDPNADLTWFAQMGSVLLESGRVAEMEMSEEVLSRASAPEVPMAWQSGMSWLLSVKGEPERGRAILRSAAADGFDAVPWDLNRVATLCEFTEAALLLGEYDVCALLEPLLAPFAANQAVNARAIDSYGSVRYFLGRLAAARSDLSVAIDQLERAVEANLRIGAGPRTALARVELARVLLSRGETGDAERAGKLEVAAREAVESYGCAGLL